MINKEIQMHLDAFGNLVEVDYATGIVQNYQTSATESGYIRVQLKGRPVGVHSIIMHQLGYDLTGKVVNHKNGNKSDNRLDNLEVMTQSDNVVHGIKSGLNTNTRLTEQDVREIRNYLSMGMPAYELAEAYKVSNRAIYDIKNSKTWSWVV